MVDIKTKTLKAEQNCSKETKRCIKIKEVSKDKYVDIKTKRKKIWSPFCHEQGLFEIFLKIL